MPFYTVLPLDQQCNACNDDEMERIEEIKCVFELASAGLAVVKRKQWQCQQTPCTAVEKPVLQDDEQQSDRKRSEFYRQAVELLKRFRRFARFVIEDRCEERRYRTGEIVIDAEKVIDRPDAAECGGKDEERKCAFGFRADIKLFFQPLQAVDQEDRQGKGQQDVAVIFALHDDIDRLAEDAQPEDGQKSLALVTGIATALCDEEGKDRVGEPPDDAKQRDLGKYPQTDVIDQHEQAGE